MKRISRIFRIASYPKEIKPTQVTQNYKVIKTCIDKFYELMSNNSNLNHEIEEFKNNKWIKRELCNYCGEKLAEFDIEDILQDTSMSHKVPLCYGCARELRLI